MAEAATKLPIKTEASQAVEASKTADWQPFEALRNQVDRLFHDFQGGFLQDPLFRPLSDIESFWRRDFGFNVTPAINIVEKDTAFEVTAELPGGRLQQASCSNAVATTRDFATIARLAKAEQGINFCRDMGAL
jgi:hypothetical protein